MRRFRLLRRLGWLRAVPTFVRALFLPTLAFPVGAFFFVRAFVGDLSWSAVACAAISAAVIGAVGAMAFRTGLDNARAKLYTTDTESDEVAIGTDGVRWRGVLGTRVVRWSEVERVSVATGSHLTLVVQLVDGGSLRWPVVDGRGLLDAARSALTRYRDRTAAPVPAELAAPDQDVGAWIERLRTLLAAASDYRARATTPDALLRVAEDPRAAPLARVASALALSAAAEPIKARVRVVIDDVADPEVADVMAEALSGTVTAERVTRVKERG